MSSASLEWATLPTFILARQFDRSFAIRGLHFDTQTGYILKVDQFGKIAISCVYKGRQKASISEIVDAYKGESITAESKEIDSSPDRGEAAGHRLPKVFGLCALETVVRRLGRYTAGSGALQFAGRISQPALAAHDKRSVVNCL